MSKRETPYTGKNRSYSRNRLKILERAELYRRSKGIKPRESGFKKPGHIVKHHRVYVLPEHPDFKIVPGTEWSPDSIGSWIWYYIEVISKKKDYDPK